MTEEAKLADEVKALIIRHLKLENLRPADIDDEAPLFTTSDGGTGGMGLDSIDALELVLGVEQSFGVRIEDEEEAARAFTSVSSLCRFIRTHQAASKRS